MLELALHYLVLLEQYLGAESILIIRIMQQLINSEQSNEATTRGRPKIYIDQERLIFLKECGFKTKDIASIFGCSARIERRINEYGIPRRCDVYYSAVTDAELDEKVLSFFPRCGQKSVDGRLRSEGIERITEKS